MTTDYFALERVLEQSGDFDDDYLIDLIHKRYAALSAERRERPPEVSPFCPEQFPTAASLETHVEWEHE